MIKIENNKAHTFLNNAKETTCIQFRDYIYLISKIGNGVMLQSQLERFMEHYLKISNKTVYRHLKELEANQIISIQKINKVNLIVLKKYAYRFIKQEETGREIKSKDIASPRTTEGKIKKSAWISEYILRTVVANKDMGNIVTLIDYLRNTTTLITSKKDSIECFDTLIKNGNINTEIRQNITNEVNNINHMRHNSNKNLAIESKNRSNDIKSIKQINNKDAKTNFTFNSMFYNNLYITSITDTKIDITFLDVSNVMNESKMIWIIENIYNYFFINLMSYAENYEVKNDIQVTIQILLDARPQAIKIKKLLQDKKEFLEEKVDNNGITKKEITTLNMLQKVDIRFSYLDINKNCFKNVNIIF